MMAPSVKGVHDSGVPEAVFPQRCGFYIDEGASRHHHRALFLNILPRTLLCLWITHSPQRTTRREKRKDGAARKNPCGPEVSSESRTNPIHSEQATSLALVNRTILTSSA